MLPARLDGFDRLVQWVMDSGSWGWAESVADVPDDDDVWRELARYAFVRAGFEEARCYYIYEILDSILDMSKIRSGWSSRAEKLLVKELSRETKSLKVSLLDKYREMRDDIFLELYEAKTKLFDSGEVTQDKLWKLENTRIRDPGSLIDRSGISNLITFIVHSPKVRGYGYTKSVLWLNACGVGKDYCAPSRPTIDFLKDYTGSSLYYEDLSGVLSYNYSEKPSYRGKPANFWVIQKMIRDAVDYLSKVLSLPDLCNGDLNYAIWHYYKTKSLLAFSRKKREFTPTEFLRFVRGEGWAMSELGGKLIDIDLQADVTTALTEFVKGI